jgi:molybdopterin biosynthesis enzyme
MTPIAEAQAQLVAAVPQMPVVSAPLEDAIGLVSARDVVAEQTVPPFANCSLDGYAVRHDDIGDTPAELRVLGMVPAGSVAPSPVEPGTAWKVMTGAPLPDGADTVVMVELTSATADSPLASAGDTVSILKAPPRGTGIRAAGSDVKPGDRVLAAGEVLTAPRLAVLAGIGVRHVDVPRRPRVGVLITGDEPVSETRPLRPGEIYESNGVMVRALVADSGCEVVDLGIGRDDTDDIVERLTKAAGECDAVLTTGGVSMGDTDPVRRRSTGSVGSTGCRCRCARPSLSRMRCSTAPRGRCRSSGCRATRCRRW